MKFKTQEFTIKLKFKLNLATLEVTKALYHYFEHRNKKEKKKAYFLMELLQPVSLREIIKVRKSPRNPWG
jgi:hypothetical protein